jgi:hypothetical protein
MAAATKVVNHPVAVIFPEIWMTKFRSKTRYRKEMNVRASEVSLSCGYTVLFQGLTFRAVLAALGFFIVVGQGIAGQADVVAVEASQSTDKSWRFSVTVRHDDAGWDHYADKWAIFAPDGAMLGERVLAHPHDNEQPFTRSQSGIIIDDNIDSVVVKAHDNVHDWGDEFTYRLEK